MEKRFYSKNEVADVLGLSSNYFAVQLKNKPENFPPFRKIGRKYLFPIEDFENWMKQKPQIGEA